jgi:acetolactate synthase-1/2/3 large subunit
VAAGVTGDARLALAGLLDELAPTTVRDGAWGANRARATREGSLRGVSDAERAVREAFDRARAILPRDAILTHDAARLNSWTGYVWPVYEPDGSLWPWGSATLGFALGAANGAAVAAPDRRVVASCGDGGFLFTAAELATAVAHGLNVTVFIHDDAAFGSIAAYQRKHHGRAFATDLVNPDLLAFARSFGVPAERIDSIAELPAALGRATAAPGPSVVVYAGPLDPPWS